MKKLFKIIAFLWIIIFFYALSADKLLAAPQLYGSGTQDDPFQINTVNDLLAFSKAVNSGDTFEKCYVSQNSNLDLSHVSNFTPIGDISKGNYFAGIYNGNGHYISNITINSDLYAALFGTLSGKVENLGIESGSISGNYAAGICVLSSGSSGMILNCYNKADIHGIRASGIADTFNGSIINCWNTGKCIGRSENAGNVTGCNSSQLLYTYSIDSLYPVNTFIGQCGYSRILDAEGLDQNSFADELNYNLGKCIKFGLISYEEAAFWHQGDNGCSFDNKKTEPGWQPEITLHSEYRQYKSKQKGSAKKPITIDTPEDLVVFKTAVNSGQTFSGMYFFQSDDLDMSGIDTWTVIGEIEKNRQFAGIYNGNGKKISNLKSEKQKYSGLFGILSGSVYNLALDNVLLEGECVGGIACMSYGEPEIFNCSVQGTLISSNRGGGIADDFSSGNIMNCWSNLNSSETIYGICGYSANMLKDCFSNLKLFPDESVQHAYIKNIKGDNAGDLPPAYILSDDFEKLMNTRLINNIYAPVEIMKLWKYNSKTNELTFSMLRHQFLLKCFIWVSTNIKILLIIGIILCIFLIRSQCKTKRYKNIQPVPYARNATIDLLRIIFCVNIMLLHWGQWMGDENMYAPCGYIGVSFFFIVTGYFMAKNISEKEQNSAKSTDLSYDTTQYIWKKYKRIAPYFIVAAVISFLAVSVYTYSGTEELLYNLRDFTGEILMLQMTGLPTYAIMATEWYLSASFITIAVLYPIVRNHRKTYTYVVAPPLVLLLLGWILHKYNCLSATGSWTGLSFEGVMRAFALVSAGCVCYEISGFIQKKCHNTKARAKLTIFEMIIWISVFIGMIYGQKYTRFDFTLTLLIFIGLCITFSEATYLDKIISGNIAGLAAKWSVLLFLCHGYLLRILPQILKGWNRWSSLCIFLICSFITALIVLIAAKRLEYLLFILKKECSADDKEANV